MVFLGNRSHTGVMTMNGVLTGDISASIAGIADAVDPLMVKMDYPQASGAIIGNTASTCSGWE